VIRSIKRLPPLLAHARMVSDPSAWLPVQVESNEHPIAEDGLLPRQSRARGEDRLQAGVECIRLPRESSCIMHGSADITSDEADCLQVVQEIRDMLSDPILERQMSASHCRFGQMSTRS
jgi:hypothetical protein